MHILHIAHQFAPETRGGLENYLESLVRVQLAAGHTVKVMCGSMQPSDVPSFETLEHEGLIIERFHRSDLYFDSWDKMDAPIMGDLLMKRITIESPEVVHLHHWIRLTQDLGTRITAAGFPLVAHLHDFSTSCPRGFRQTPDNEYCMKTLEPANCLHCAHRWPWLDDAMMSLELDYFAQSARAELDRANRIVCSSESVKSIIIHGLGIPDERFAVIPLASRARFVGHDGAAKKSTADFHIAFWGSVTDRKGVDLLISSFAALVAGGDHDASALRLSIFGEIETEELAEDLKTAAGDLPIQFVGRFDYEQLADAGIDLAVFPSRCLETYGLVLDEALELGVPVVIPDHGAMSERAGDAGEVFAINDAGALTCALGAMWKDAELYAKRKLKAQRPQWSLEDNALALEGIYTKALAEGAPRPGCGLGITASQRRAHMAARQEFQFRKLIGG